MYSLELTICCHTCMRFAITFLSSLATTQQIQFAAGILRLSKEHPIYL